LPSNVSTQYFETGNVSFRATANVTGKRFVAPSADVTGGPGLSTDLQNVFRCAHCPAGKRPAGVAKYDVSSGSVGGMHGQPGQIVPVTTGAAIVAGAEVESDASGQAITWAGTIATAKAGLAMSGAGSGADAMIKLY
jgi:hypothetical protein